MLYTVYMKQNYPDHNLNPDLDLEICLVYKHLILIILIQILDRLQWNNDWTMKNNVMRFIIHVLNNEFPV